MLGKPPNVPKLNIAVRFRPKRTLQGSLKGWTAWATEGYSRGYSQNDTEEA